MADIAIIASQVAAAPQDYTLPGAQEILLKAVGCTINGTNAAGTFLPALQCLDPAGHVMWTAVNRSLPIAAGGSALVSWFPGGGVDQAIATQASGGAGITRLGSPNATLSITNPTGPSVGVDMPASGVAAGTYGDATDVGQFTVDAEGRITTATAVPIASGAGGGFVQVAQATRTSGDLTTSSTTFVDVTGLTVTLTTGAHRCLVLFSGNAHNSLATDNVAFDLAIDGTRQGQDFGLTINQASTTGEPNTFVGFTFLTAALSAASHTLKIQWRVDAGTGTLFASTTVTPAILTVMELGI